MYVKSFEICKCVTLDSKYINTVTRKWSIPRAVFSKLFSCDFGLIGKKIGH